MRACKKPIAVECVRYRGLENGQARFDGEMPEWLSDALRVKGRHEVGAVYVAYVAEPAIGLFINTLEGPMTVTAGSYIVRGAAGELWAVRGDIFEATYEPEADMLARAEAARLAAAELDEARKALAQSLEPDSLRRVMQDAAPLAAGIRLLHQSEVGHRAALDAATEKDDRLVVAVVLGRARCLTVAGPDRSEAACQRFAEQVAQYYHMLVGVAADLAAKAGEPAVDVQGNPDGPAG